MTSTLLPPVHFLLVDDLEENLQALEALLRRDGLVLLTARSGAQALELLLKHDVALALVDVQMNEMDGFELAELMRGTERTRRVPIIFVTAGNADRQRRFRGYEAGAVDFMAKPIEPDILRSKADVFFELHRQRQEVSAQRDELKAATEENARLLAESRQHAAALHEADLRKDEFLAMLGHELRNPLAPVRNAVEILRMSATTDATICEAREIISRQVSHMVHLVDDLLDVARIARGKIQLMTEPFDLSAVIRQTAEDYRPTLAAAGIVLELDITNQPMRMMGVAVRVAQVMGNLLHNACKFTPRGGKVTVRASVAGFGNSAQVSVHDTGAGLDPDVISRLFEPFSQADQALDRGKGGLGLGLALVKGLVELHGGSVSASSPGLGEGSTFVLDLPIRNLKSDVESSPKSLSPRVNEERLRVLIIDDNQDAAISLKLFLSFLGHQVDVAFDGASGLTAARANLPDVLISDLGLPGSIDGYEVAKSVRGDSRLAHTYLIALSGYGKDDDLRRTQDAGFDQHMVKPVDPGRMEKALVEQSIRNRAGVSGPSTA